MSDIDINEFLKLYQSIGNSDIYSHAAIVDVCVEKGLVPKSVRYGVFSNGKTSINRGAVLTTSGDSYYFNWPEDADFKLVKADNTEKLKDIDNMMKSFHNGMDLKNSEDDEEDEIEKAPQSPGGSGGFPVTPEGTNPELGAMEAPSSAIATTPDDPNVGRDWHKSIYSNEDALSKLRACRDQFLNKTKKSVSQEYKQRFIDENKSINLVKSNTAKLTKEYNDWQAKDIKTRLGSLSNWMNKNK